MKNPYHILTIVIFILCITLFAKAADPVAVVVKSKGKVDIKAKNNTTSKKLQKGGVLSDGDKITTGAASFCAIKFIDDKSLLRMKENSTCVIEGKREEDHINKNIIVEIGTFFSSLFKPRGKYTVTTPTSVASVKGTKFWTIQKEFTIHIGIEGLVDLSNDAGRVLLRTGQTAVYTSKNKLPEMRLTRSDEVPELDESLDGLKSMEIEFKDDKGNVKMLRLEYSD